MCVNTSMKRYEYRLHDLISYLPPPSTSLPSRPLAWTTRTRLIWFIRFSSTFSSTIRPEFSSMDNVKFELFFLERGLFKLEPLQVFILDDLQFFITWSTSNMVDITYRYENVCMDKAVFSIILSKTERDIAQ